MSALQDNDFPPDYLERVDRVRGYCAEALSVLHGDLLAQLRVVCHYLQAGDQEGISHEELIDFLGVSTPSVLDSAGYTDSEASDVMKALTYITYDEHGRPQAPASLPDPSPQTAPAEQKHLDL